MCGTSPTRTCSLRNNNKYIQQLVVCHNQCNTLFQLYAASWRGYDVGMSWFESDGSSPPCFASSCWSCISFHSWIKTSNMFTGEDAQSWGVSIGITLEEQQVRLQWRELIIVREGEFQVFPPWRIAHLEEESPSAGCPKDKLLSVGIRCIDGRIGSCVGIWSSSLGKSTASWPDSSFKFTTNDLQTKPVASLACFETTWTSVFASRWSDPNKIASSP